MMRLDGKHNSEKTTRIKDIFSSVVCSLDLIARIIIFFNLLKQVYIFSVIKISMFCIQIAVLYKCTPVQWITTLSCCLLTVVFPRRGGTLGVQCTVGEATQRDD